MRIRIPIIITLFIAASLAVFTSCTNEKEEFTTEKLEDYMPLAAGKYITYRLDSMVFTAFGTVTEIHKYQVKHVIDSRITDNLGRPSYRVYVYIRDSVNATSWTPAQPWTNSSTYFITPLADQVEVIENNLRFIKLHLPIKNTFSWNGNRYLPTNPYEPLYNFSNDNSMGDWDFFYDGQATSFSHKGINYTDVQTVEHIDETFNIPVNPASYASKSRSVERYAKNIGMVYREHELWEYQVTPSRYYLGFGVTMWMIDHN
jgi:hypothetical protein